MTITSSQSSHMLFAVERSRWAPSVHNTQPWIFRITEQGIDLLSDSSRGLTALDPSGREMTISCGAALLHLRIALQAAGYSPTVVILPDAERPDILARVTPGVIGEPDAGSVELDRCATTRQTNRRAYHGDLTPDVIEALQAAAEFEGAGLQTIVDEDDRTSVKVWQQAADAYEVTNPAYRRELRGWVGYGRGDDGIPVAATTEMSSRASDLAPRDFAFDASGGMPQERDDPGTALFVLFTESDTPAAWMQAGQALGRVWLEATRLKAVMQPLSQSVEDGATRLAMRHGLRLLGFWPQILLRAGHAQPQPRTPRRSTGNLIYLDASEQPDNGVPAGVSAQVPHSR